MILVNDQLTPIWNAAESESEEFLTKEEFLKRFKDKEGEGDAEPSALETHNMCTKLL